MRPAPFPDDLKHGCVLPHHLGHHAPRTVSVCLIFESIQDQCTDSVQPLILRDYEGELHRWRYHPVQHDKVSDPNQFIADESPDGASPIVALAQLIGKGGELFRLRPEPSHVRIVPVETRM